MKISDTPKTPPLRGVKKSRRPETSKPTAPIDEAILAGIPATELTPKVRAALLSLIEEVQALRTELNAAKSRLAEAEDLADRDAMLDILNRRAFVRELDRMMAMSERYNLTGSLIFVDLDDLKKLNDEMGHLAGDRALEVVAEILTSNIRQTDVAGRLGGDEFGLLLTQADQSVAEKKGADLAALVAATPIKWKDGEFSVSISLGVVEIAKGGSAAEALDRADLAMYEAKRRKP